MYTKKHSDALPYRHSDTISQGSGDASAILQEHNSGPSTISQNLRTSHTQKARLFVKRLIFAACVLLGCIAVFITAFTLIETGMTRTRFAGAQSEMVTYTSLNKIFDQYQANVSLKISILDDAPLTLDSPKVTVGEVIDSLNIEVDESTVVNYPLDSVVNEDMEIEIASITYNEVVITDAIPYSTEVIGVQTIPKGTRKVVQKGVEGTSTRVLNQEYRNGELVSETVISETVTKKPQNKIIYEGAGGSFINAAGKTIEYSYYIDVTATAYGSNVGEYTYTGKRVAKGMIAVDPTVIPLGTKCYVSGSYGDYGVCYAEDIGGGIKGKRIDIFLGDDLDVIYEFGRRKMRVYIME